MSKPGRRENKPSSEIARFTNRQEHRARFYTLLRSIDEPPVLMFYGVGGAGKTWLLKKLREETPHDIPTAFLDFAAERGGRLFVVDPAAALREIRHQLERPTPRFDLAFAMMRHKQGVGEGPKAVGEGTVGLTIELAAELAQKAVESVPGVNVLVNRLSKPLWTRFKATPLGEYLSTAVGNQFALDLRSRNAQEIGNELLYYLAEDLRSNLPAHFDRAVRAVFFLDTFEALSSGPENSEQKRFHEQWIRELSANCDFALMVIAGQNRLNWDEAEPEWASSLEQHLVSGLSESDARQFLVACGIDQTDVQAVILRTAREPDGGYHCFSLGLCADIVYVERRNGQEPRPDTLSFRPQDWEALARRFLKSLASDAERRWIERLALTPAFDEAAARSAFSQGRSAAQDAAWEALPDYSFIESLSGKLGWFAVRPQMRWALENQPAARERVLRDHQLWRELWEARSQSEVDEAAPLAWYHHYSLEPSNALTKWQKRAEIARISVPPRMQEHFDLLRWWEPIDLLKDTSVLSVGEAWSLNSLGCELWRASLGNRDENLQRAIDCYNAALRVCTENDFPQDWAATQNNLGNAWRDLPSGNRDENLQRAIDCYNAALRVYTENDFPREHELVLKNIPLIHPDL